MMMMPPLLPLPEADMHRFHRQAILSGSGGDDAKESSNSKLDSDAATSRSLLTKHQKQPALD